ncbi:SDR family oxidoreductase [Flexithrix dorotheae]|uniref:SDR family oxidoreductase n=1 Tax=Flexithrix dorotheae TaxID=70993 RepID=UPI00036DA745|nr:SDR family oxidoreductase [Flexithrix dorotheae]
MENIKEKVIIITGASSGLGESTALHLSKHGAKVVLAARRIEKIQLLSKKIQEHGGQALAVATDVSNKQDMIDMAEATIKKFGRIDVLINNAGIMPLSALPSLQVDEWDKMIDVNVKGVLYGIAAVLPYMKEQKSGLIINTSSVAGHKIFPGSTVYSATKTAVRIISEGLRQEVKDFNIRTSIISPGAVKTELLDHITDEKIQSANKEYVGNVGLKPETFARLVAFIINEPEEVDINEILFRPTAQEL